jgi:hypothetical protein
MSHYSRHSDPISRDIEELVSEHTFSILRQQMRLAINLCELSTIDLYIKAPSGSDESLQRLTGIDEKDNAMSLGNASSSSRKYANSDIYVYDIENTLAWSFGEDREATMINYKDLREPSAVTVGVLLCTKSPHFELRHAQTLSQIVSSLGSTLSLEMEWRSRQKETETLRRALIDMEDGVNAVRSASGGALVTIMTMLKMLRTRMARSVLKGSPLGVAADDINLEIIENCIVQSASLLALLTGSEEELGRVGMDHGGGAGGGDKDEGNRGASTATADILRRPDLYLPEKEEQTINIPKESGDGRG